MTPRPDAFQNYSSPYIWHHASHSEVVVGGSTKLRGYDAKTGEERWVVTNLPTFVCTSPVAAGDLLIFGGWTNAHIEGQDVFQVALHEIGYLIGLGHSVLRSKALLSPRFRPSQPPNPKFPVPEAREVHPLRCRDNRAVSANHQPQECPMSVIRPEPVCTPTGGA